MADVNIEPLIEFKPLEKRYLEWARQLHNDKEVLRMLTDPHIVSEAEQKKWFKRLKNSSTSERWVVFIGETPVGIIRLDQIDKWNKSVCVGMDMYYKYRGKGYAKPIYKKLLDYWFITEGFNRVWLLVAGYNQVAKKLYEGLGFIVEGNQRQGLWREGKHHDYIMMSILKEEYKK